MVRLQPGSPDFFLKVVVRRLTVLRQRAQMPDGPDVFAPLPPWLVSDLREARSVRLALHAVCEFREHALRLNRIPTQEEYRGEVEPSITPPPPEQVDFDKLWADHLDGAPAVQNRLLTTTKAQLLAWWATEASREHAAVDPAEVNASTCDDNFHTDIIDADLAIVDFGDFRHRMDSYAQDRVRAPGCSFVRNLI